METLLGRPLEKHERVHHRNGIRNDNRPENLELWTSTKKDPPGIRSIDEVKHAITQLPKSDVQRLAKWITKYAESRK